VTNNATEGRGNLPPDFSFGTIPTSVLGLTHRYTGRYVIRRHTGGEEGVTTMASVTLSRNPFCRSRSWLAWSPSLLVAGDRMVCDAADTSGLTFLGVLGWAVWYIGNALLQLVLK
jgi:hypothetical protein